MTFFESPSYPIGHTSEISFGKHLNFRFNLGQIGQAKVPMHES